MRTRHPKPPSSQQCSLGYVFAGTTKTSPMRTRVGASGWRRAVLRAPARAARLVSTLDAASCGSAAAGEGGAC
eukprot:1177844-Pleurochrysis_carterae.AAC.1